MKPSAVARPPDIDPRRYAVESRSWGDEFTCHVVRYDGKWSTWTIRPHDDGTQVYEQPSEAAARDFMTTEMARLLAATDWGDRVASVSAGDEISTRVLFSAAVLDGGEDGIWLTTCTADGDEDRYELAGFDGLGTAVEAFAASASRAADVIAGQEVSWPELTAGYLRYCAAVARAGAARAELGDLIRRRHGRIRVERAVSRVAATVGVSREFLYRVLADSEWTWKGVTSMRQNTSSAPRAHEATAARSESWSAAISLAVQAPEEAEAKAIAHGALGGLGLPASGETAVRPAGDGLWAVTADLQLATVGPFEPDNARTRLSYLMGLLPEKVPWVTRVKEDRGTAEWSPSIWERPSGSPDELLHPAVRGARIQVSATGGR